MKNKKSGKKVKTKDKPIGSLSPATKGYYHQLPACIREDYTRVVMNMRAMPAKKAKMTFAVAVKIWKPVIMALKADFDKHKQARELPHNMKFIEYFGQFQQAADRDFRKTHERKKVAKRPQSLKQKKSHSRSARSRRK